MVTLRNKLNVRSILSKWLTLFKKGNIIIRPAIVDFSDGNIKEFNLIVCPIKCYLSLYYLSMLSALGLGLFLSMLSALGLGLFKDKII